MERTPARRLTPGERERIIEMRLSGIPVRTVAQEIPTTTRTVQDTFTKYCRARAEEFREQSDPIRAHIIERLFRIANDAAKAGAKANAGGDLKALASFLSEERAALLGLAKFFEGPIQVEHTGDVGFTAIRIVETIDVDEV